MTDVEELVKRLRDIASSFQPTFEGSIHAQRRDTVTEAADALSSLQEANMLRGGIAKPSLRSMLHAYGNGLLEAFDRTVEIAARNEASPDVDRAREALSSTPHPSPVTADDVLEIYEQTGGVTPALRKAHDDYVKNTTPHPSGLTQSGGEGWRSVVQAYIDEEEKQIAKFWGERKFDLHEIHRQRSIAAGDIFERLRKLPSSPGASPIDKGEA